MSDVSDEPENAVVNLSDPEVKSLLLAWLKTVEQRHNNVCRPVVAALMSAREALEAATVAKAAVANDTWETVDALAAAVRLAKTVDATWSAFLSNGPPKNVIIKSIEILEDEESRATTTNRQTPTSDSDREKETNNDNDGNSNDDASSTCDETPPLTQLSKKLTRIFNNPLEAMEIPKGLRSPFLLERLRNSVVGALLECPRLREVRDSLHILLEPRRHVLLDLPGFLVVHRTLRDCLCGYFAAYGRLPDRKLGGSGLKLVNDGVASRPATPGAGA
jgi:hypothetical protein